VLQQVMNMLSLSELETLATLSKEFLLVTLAGSFFVDLANAIKVKGFLALPWFH
jgi:sodium--glutamate symport carrier gltS